jgi:drug/metabolite transporter (DMT)-like permease
MMGRFERQARMSTTPETKTTPTSRRNKQLAIYALFTGGLAIGSVPIFVRLSQVGPSATAFWRLLLALPIFLVWMFLERRRGKGRGPGSLEEYARMMAAGLFFAADLTVWHWSIKLTSVANATLLANFAPIFVALGGWLLYRQRVSLRFVIGMLTALAGTIFLVGTSFNLSSQHLVGDVLGLVAAVFYAGYILTIKRLRSDFSTPTTLAYSGIAASMALLAIALGMNEVLIPATPAGWLDLFGLAWFSHVGGWGLITFSLAQLPAAFSSVALLIQPVVATLLAYRLLGETLGLAQVAGGALVLAGIIIARREA